MPVLESRHPRWTWYPLCFLLLLCLVRGLWVTRGLVSPPILDTFRDAGFVQGILDGNWWGDPSIAGAWRYYPPLIHALFAAVAAITGADPLRLLIGAAPWVNLIVPLGFFLMSRSLIGAPSAVFGTAMLVLFNGWALPAWISATYHPWSSVPLLAMGLFFLSLWLVHARIRAQKAGDALLIGCAIGLTFLAHTVPAVILAAILPVAAVTARGLNRRTVGWVSMIGAVTLLWSLPLLLPLIVSYRLHVLNAIPGGHVDPLLAQWPPSRAMLLTLLPGMLALPLATLMRAELPVSRVVGAILGVWIILPALFLTRHYVCGADSQAAVCTVFVVAVHHWFTYLQAALTCVAGLAAWGCISRVLRAVQRPRWWAAAGWMIAAICGTTVFCLRHADSDTRHRAQQIRGFFDWQVYAWVEQHSAPNDLFVTELPEESLNPASLAVMAAGRPSVALPATYSNPYVGWESRYRQSERYLAAARRPAAPAEPMLCHLIGAARRDARAYVILPNSQPIATPILRADAVGATNTLYRVMSADCVDSQASPALTQGR